jgi:hypothetical protein
VVEFTNSRPPLAAEKVGALEELFIMPVPVRARVPLILKE